jgi:hypothetical protein
MARRLVLAFTGALIIATMAAPQFPAGAVTTFADAPQRGWYDSTGFHDGTNDNYCVGPGCDPSGYDTRNYIVVDLTGYSAQAATQGVTNAWVNFSNPAGAGTPRSFELHDVTTSITDLEASHTSSATGVGIFNDLGNGTLYGSYTPASVSENPVTVDLNSEGRLALTKRLGGYLAIGGSLVSGTSSDLILGNSQGLASYAVQVGLNFGTKTSITLKGPGKVAKGTSVTFSGAISSTAKVCKNRIALQVFVGSKTMKVTTASNGSYSFKVKISKKTRLRVFDPGTTGDGPPACAGSDAYKTVRVS